MEAETIPAVRSLVALSHVASVPDSVALYRKLGFEVGNTPMPPESTEPSWVCLERDKARLLSRASAPVLPEEQAVLFYKYFENVEESRRKLEEVGIAAGPIRYPIYNPRRQFRVQDPDGHVLMLSHT